MISSMEEKGFFCRVVGTKGAHQIFLGRYRKHLSNDRIFTLKMPFPAIPVGTDL